MRKHLTNKIALLCLFPLIVFAENGEGYEDFTTGEIIVLSDSGLVLEDDPERGQIGYNLLGELGGSISTGNENDSFLDVSLSGTYFRNKWLLGAHALMQLKTNSDGDLSKRNYEVGAEVQYAFNEKNYAFGNAEYTNQKFRPYETVVTGAGGYGWRILRQEPFTWEVQAGPGIRYSVDEDTSDTSTEIIMTADSFFSYIPNDKVIIKQIFNVRAGETTTFLRSSLSLITPLGEKIHLKLEQVSEYNTKIPENSKNTVKLDTTTSVKITYDIL